MVVEVVEIEMRWAEFNSEKSKKKMAAWSCAGVGVDFDGIARH